MSKYAATIEIKQTDDYGRENCGRMVVSVTQYGETARDAWQRAYETLGTIPTDISSTPPARDGGDD